jgi:hypothetical protein
MITDAEIAAVLDRTAQVLRNMGHPVVSASPCTCSRCDTRRHRVAAPVQASGPDGPGGALVTNPHPLPSQPPSGDALLPSDEEIEAQRRYDALMSPAARRLGRLGFTDAVTTILATPRPRAVPSRDAIDF